MQLGLEINEECREEEKHTSVTHVSKHDAKEEGESHTSIDSWIDLFVGGHSISVDNLLVDVGELVSFHKSGRYNFFKRNFLNLKFVVSCVVFA